MSKYIGVLPLDRRQCKPAAVDEAAVERAVVWVSEADIAPFVGAPQMAEFWGTVTLASGPGDGRTVPLYAAQPPAAEPKTLPVPTRVYLTDKAAVIAGNPQRGWDEEGPDAHNCDAMGCATFGRHVLARVPFTDERALSQQPAAVDEAMVDRACDAYVQIADDCMGLVRRKAMRAALIAALTAQHQETPK